MNEHPLDELGAYALAALDRPDRERVGRHLAACQHCRLELASHEQAAWALAEASTMDPSPQLRARIVEQAGVAARGRNRTSSVWELPRRWLLRPLPAALPLALAIVLAVALGSLQAIRGQADAYEQAVAGIVDGRVVQLTRSAEADGPRGALVVPESGQAYLILDLPRPPTGKTWEAWVMRGETPIAAGLTGDRAGLVTLTLEQSVRPGDGVVLTLEDARGASVPTSPMVLVGRT